MERLPPTYLDPDEGFDAKESEMLELVILTAMKDPPRRIRQEGFVKQDSTGRIRQEGFRGRLSSKSASPPFEAKHP